ncbi:hypothetical protein [Dokdonia sp.]|uniref:hypothetical protein n=1 Tax=Dokdonia sp. TaxID=2024995 RepID=UPI003265061B
MEKPIIRDILSQIRSDNGKIKPELINKSNYFDLNKMIDYLDNGRKISTVASKEICELCGEEAGSRNYHIDGKWIWPIWIKHYLVKHKLELPESFILYMRENNFKILEANLVEKIANQKIDFDVI